MVTKRMPELLEKTWIYSQLNRKFCSCMVASLTTDYIGSYGNRNGAKCSEDRASSYVCPTMQTNVCVNATSNSGSMHKN